ncbi:MAG: thioredoxin domain-containing protein [Candidatus Caenarcaniphilales bacterium]|nr:thioredoxin domain-containing protein [Candidatus Caenarcaniphilales bacterium]
MFSFIILISVLSGCTSVNKDSAGTKAQEYLTKHIFKNGITSEVTDVKKEGSFFTVSMKILKDGNEVDKVKVYITEDGKHLSLGPIFDINNPPPSAEEKQAEALKSIPKKDKPSVELFVMTGCPFGVQAETAFMPVIKHLGGSIDFTPRYVIYSNYQGGGPEYCVDKENKYCSMHGAEEAREGVRQICIWNNQQDKWWNYIDKFNKDCKIDAQINQCAEKVAKDVGIDYSKVKECESSSTNELLEKEVQRNKKFNVAGSPTIIINETLYEGNRSPNAILSAICNGFKNKPEVCNKKIEGGDQVTAAQGGCGT